MKQNFTYKAFVTRVVDADTIDVRIDLGFGVSYTDRLRINDYDAPETHRPRNEDEREHGKEATQEATRLLYNRYVIVTTHKDKKGKYGRYLASVYLVNGAITTDYAEYMKAHDFEKRESYG